MKTSVLLKESLILYVVATLITFSAKTQTHANASSWQGAIVQFTAQYTKPNVTFSWKSADEIVLSYYQLERSTDGSVFTTTGIVFGPERNANGTGYTYVDRSVAGSNGLVYYRLKIVNTDGKFMYSPIRIVRLGDEDPSVIVKAYPNPIITDLKINLPASWQGKEIKYELVNTNGQLIRQINHSSAGQTETIAVNDLEKGMYFIKVNCIGQTAMQKIIKN